MREQVIGLINEVITEFNGSDLDIKTKFEILQELNTMKLLAENPETPLPNTTVLTFYKALLPKTS